MINFFTPPTSLMSRTRLQESATRISSLTKQVPSVSIYAWVLVESSSSDLAAIDESQTIIRAMARMGIEADAIDACNLIVINDGPSDALMHIDGDHLRRPDVVLVRSGAETHESTLNALEVLHEDGVRILPKPAAIRVAKHKFAAQRRVAKNGVPVPRTGMLNPRRKVVPDIVRHVLGRPQSVVKSDCGTCGALVEAFWSEAELREAPVENIFSDPHTPLLIQQLLSEAGQCVEDIRVWVLGGEPIAAIKRRSAVGERVSNYSRGGSVTVHEMTPELAAMSRHVSRILDLPICGIDWMTDESGEYRFLEANLSPGFTGLMTAHADLNIPEMLANYLAHLIERNE
jgi:gamma-F420-2:alpha-L-glutamate ligase